MNVKDQFLTLGIFNMQEEKQTRFWEDVWLGNHTLKSQYPSLYNIVRRRNATFAEMFRSTPLTNLFRRDLVGDKLRDWHNLVARLLNVNL